MRAHRAWSIGTGLALLFASPARAADDAGTQSVFAEGAGNRAVALGGAFVAAADDASSILWNPAGLGFVKRSEMQAVQSVDLGFGQTESFAALALPSWRWGTAALSMRHFGVGGVEERDDRNVLLGDDLKDEEFEAALGFGRALSEAWSVGASVKLQHQSLAGFSGSGLGVDLGVSVRPASALHLGDSWAQGLTWGFSVRNLVRPAIRLDQESVADPTAVRTGLAWRSLSSGGRGLLAEVDLSQAAGASPKLRAGVEYALHPAAALRLGMNNGNLAAGAGLRWRDLALEYAFENTPLAPAHRAGLTLRFGATTDESRAAHLGREDEAVQRRLAEGFRHRQAEQVAQLLARAAEARTRGDLDGALEQTAWVHTLEPENEEASQLESQCLHEKAIGLEGAGDFTAAALVWDRAVSAAPADSVARRGSVRCRQESDARARRTQERRARFASGMDSFAADDLRAARESFEAIVRIEPADSEAVKMLSRTQAALTRRASDLAEQALRAVRAGSLSQAAARIAEAEAYDPDASGLTQAQAALGAARSAAASGSGAPATAPTPRASAPRLSDREARDLYERGLRALRAQRTDEAVRYWELVWASRPDYRDVAANLKREYLTRGIELFAAGRLDDAVAEWDRVLKIDPSDERARGYLARAEAQRARSREILGTHR